MRDDVEEVLASIDPLLARLVEQEALAKANATDKPLSRTDWQMALGQLRIALDYLAAGVDTYVYGGANAKRLQAQRGQGLYFPFGDKQSVSKRLKQMYIDLDTVAPRVHALFFTVQADIVGSDWLERVCKLNNRNKHAKLETPVRLGGDSSVTIGDRGIRIVNVGNVTLMGNTLNGRPLDTSKPTTISTSMSQAELQHAMPGVAVSKAVINESFHVAGTKWEVVDLVRTARDGVTGLAKSFMTELGV